MLSEYNIRFGLCLERKKDFYLYFYLYVDQKHKSVELCDQLVWQGWQGYSRRLRLWDCRGKEQKVCASQLPQPISIRIKDQASG